MSEYTCIHRYKDNTGKILRYIIQDSKGLTREFKAHDLKCLIAMGRIEVSNLTLTSDGRLIHTEDKGKVDLSDLSHIDTQTLKTNKINKEIIEKSIMINKPKEDKTIPRPEIQITEKANINKTKLPGYLTTKDGEQCYIEQLGEKGRLRVYRGNWEIHFPPEKYNRIGYYVTPGYTIPGNSVARYIKCIQDAWDKLQNTMAAYPDRHIDEDCTGEIKISYSSNRRGSLWLTSSTVWIYTQAELDELLNSILAAKNRVDEVRRIQGWEVRKGLLGKILMEY